MLSQAVDAAGQLRATRPATELLMLTMSATWRGTGSAAACCGSALLRKQVKKAEDVELDHGLPLRQRSVHRWAKEHHAGIVDECVETAELGDRVLDRLGGLFLLGDAALDDQCCSTCATDLVGERLQPVLAPGGQGYRCSSC